MSWVGLRRVVSNLLATVAGWVGFKETVMGWVRRLRELRTTWETALHTRDIELIKEILSELLHLIIFQVYCLSQKHPKRYNFVIIFG